MRGLPDAVSPPGAHEEGIGSQFVFASLYGFISKCFRQEVHVRLFMRSDLLKTVTDPGRVTSVGEVLLGVQLQGLVVERALKVLQRKGIVEDIRVYRKRGSMNRTAS